MLDCCFSGVFHYGKERLRICQVAKKKFFESNFVSFEIFLMDFFIFFALGLFGKRGRILARFADEVSRSFVVWLNLK